MLLLGGCSIFGPDGSEPHTIDVSAHMVTVMDAPAGLAWFDFTGTMNSPCYQFEGIHLVQEGERIDVRVRARSTSDICIAILGQLQVRPVAVSVEPGQYTVAFWRRDAPPLELEVEVD